MYLFFNVEVVFYVDAIVKKRSFYCSYDQILQTKYVCLLYELVSLDPMITLLISRSGMYGHLGNYAYFRHCPDLLNT